jgi:excisionase family DNA binding protein
LNGRWAYRRWMPAKRKLGEDELLTVDEVAELLKVTTRTVRNLIHEQGLPAKRIGRSRMVRIYRSDVAALLNDVRGYDPDDHP